LGRASPAPTRRVCECLALTLTLSLRRKREVVLKELPLTPSSKKRGKRLRHSKQELLLIVILR